VRFLPAAGVAIAGLLWSAHVVFAEDPCIQSAPLSADEVMGYTWTGTITVISGDQIQVDVDYVYANGDSTHAASAVLTPSHDLTFRNDECAHVYGLTTGRQYLFSTSSLWPYVISAPELMAWELHSSKATVVDTAGLHGDPATVFRDRHTLSEAVALVAPSASMPATDTVASSSRGAPTPVNWLPVLVGALAGLVFLLRPHLLSRD